VEANGNGGGLFVLFLQSRYDHDHDIHAERVVRAGLTWSTTVEIEEKVGWLPGDCRWAGVEIVSRGEEEEMVGGGEFVVLWGREPGRCWGFWV